MRERFVVVTNGQHLLHDHPVEVDLPNFPGPAVCEEVDADGSSIGPIQPCQIDAGRGCWRLRGATAPGASRRYRVRLADDEDEIEPLVIARDGAEQQGRPSIEITTPTMRWLYHKDGAGFAALFDADGNDWISYRNGGGSDGRYRGLPNLLYPAGKFHPGNEGCTSRLIAAGPVRATIESEYVPDDGGRWRCRWDVYPDRAVLTLLESAGTYWFLYEGTPGGAIDYDNDLVLTSAGRRSRAGESWRETLPAPKWAGFADGATGRTLYIAKHEPSEQLDQYWPMEHNMTVFGFGRDDTDGPSALLTGAPATFTVGFVESPDAAEPAALAAMAEVGVRVE